MSDQDRRNDCAWYGGDCGQGENCSSECYESKEGAEIMDKRKGPKIKEQALDKLPVAWFIYAAEGKQRAQVMQEILYDFARELISRKEAKELLLICLIPTPEQTAKNFMSGKWTKGRIRWVVDMWKRYELFGCK